MRLFFLLVGWLDRCGYTWAGELQIEKCHRMDKEAVTGEAPSVANHWEAAGDRSRWDAVDLPVILYLDFNKCKYQMTNTDKVWTTVGMQHNAVTMEALWSFWEESHPIRWYQRNIKPSHQTLFDLKHFSGFGQRVLFWGFRGEIENYDWVP